MNDDQGTRAMHRPRKRKKGTTSSNSVRSRERRGLEAVAKTTIRAWSPWAVGRDGAGTSRRRSVASGAVGVVDLWHGGPSRDCEGWLVRH